MRFLVLAMVCCHGLSVPVAAQTQGGALEACIANAVPSMSPGATQGMRGIERGEPFNSFLLESDTASYHYRFAQAGCVGFLAVGHRSVEDVDLYLYTESGIELAADGSDGAHGYVHYCGAADLAIVVAAHMYRGHGEIRVEPLVGAPRGLPDLNGTVGGCFAGGAAAALGEPDIGMLNTPPGLDETETRMAAELAQLGYQQVGDVVHRELGPRQASSVPLRLLRNRCYALLVVGATSVLDLDVFVRSADGREVARDDSRRRDAIVRVCPSSGAEHVVDIRMYSGGGAVRLTTYQLASVPDAPNGIRGSALAAFAETIARHRRRGMVTSEVGWGFAGTRDPARLALSLLPGRCYMISAVAGPELEHADLDLLIFDERGSRIGWDLGAGANPSVNYCAQRAMQIMVQARAFGAQGRFLVLSGEGQ